MNDAQRKRELQTQWHRFYRQDIRDYKKTMGIIGIRVIALEDEPCPACRHLAGRYRLDEAPERIHLKTCERTPFPCRFTNECIFDSDEEAKHPPFLTSGLLGKLKGFF